jgi:hypothetical protein
VDMQRGQVMSSAESCPLSALDILNNRHALAQMVQQAAA